MKQHEATDSVRINKELLDKIGDVAKAKRKTITESIFFIGKLCAKIIV